jgi:cytochrome c oxidase subunit 2
MLGYNINNRISFCEPGNLITVGVITFHDFLFFFLTLIAFFVMSIMIILLVNFVIGTYNIYEAILIKDRKEILKFLKISHYPILEFIWTLVPTLLLVNMAIPTFILLYTMDILIEPKFTIKAIGNQWYWAYETNDFPWNTHKVSFDSYMLQQNQIDIGLKRLLEVDNFLILPTQMEIRLLVTSRDVLHSFALPSLSIKIDAVPGRLNHNPLFVNLPGFYFGQCSELCGPNHGFMPITIMSQTTM